MSSERECQEVIRMIESHYQTDFGPQGRELWARMISRYEVELAMAAVVAMVEYPLPANRSKPQVSDLRAILDRMRMRAREDTPAIEEEGKRGVATPEWVWVWTWVRNTREPKVEEAFPQMSAHIDATKMLSTAQYENLREEWIAAGSPKPRNPLPIPVR